MLLLSAALSTGMIGGVWAQVDMAPESPPAPGEPMAPAPEMNGTMAPGAQQTPFIDSFGPPPGFSAGGLVDLSERFVTNARGVSSRSGVRTGPDYDTRLRLSLNAHDHTPRFSGDLEYSLVGDAFARHPGLNRLSNFLTALAQATLIPDRLIVDARAFTKPILVNELGPLAAEADRPVATAANSGFRNTYGFTVAPELLFRLGNFANATTTLSEGAIFFTRPRGKVLPQTIPGETPLYEMTTTSLTQRFASGSDFDRLNWGLTGTASTTTRPTGDMSVLSGTGDVKYAVSREVALLGTGGYESITTTQRLSHHLVGPTAMAGIEINLGPDFHASAQAGMRLNYPSYIGNLFYKIGPFTTLTGELSDSIRTPGQRLLGSLGTLGVNGSGNFFDTSLGSLSGNPITAGFNPNALDRTPINSSISRYRSVHLSLTHESDIARFRLTGFATEANRLTILTGRPNVNTTGGEFVVSRDVNPSLTGDVNMGYRRQELLGGHHTIYSTQLNLNYRFSTATQAYWRVAYIHRLTDRALVRATSPLSDNVSDANMTIGIRREF